MRQQAASELASKLFEAYTTVYSSTDEGHHAQHQIEHTPAQVKTILGIT